MEKWVGSRVYQLVREVKTNSDNLVIEIQIKQLRFRGKSCRLVLIRNVNHVMEQQRLKTRALYERKLTNTMSHELLTPLNCINNLSEHLKEAQET